MSERMSLRWCALVSIPWLLLGCATDNSASEGAAIPPPVDVAAPTDEAIQHDSGLVSRVIRTGDGKERPRDEDVVVVHYSGWRTDGTLFDSSKKRGKPARFPVQAMIPGFTEGLQMMQVGEIRRMWIPAALAYGEAPKNGAPGGTLVFDVELLEIDSSMRTPDQLVPPPDSETTESGLRYEVLRQGTGTQRPAEKARVRVHYSGWTQGGELFDSSIARGEPAEFTLGRVIPGWTEGVQLMREGEKTRFWIPAHLAYGENPTQPGAPSGDLVFDIELIKILKY